MIVSCSVGKSFKYIVQLLLQAGLGILSFLTVCALLEAIFYGTLRRKYNSQLQSTFPKFGHGEIKLPQGPCTRIPGLPSKVKPPLTKKEEKKKRIL